MVQEKPTSYKSFIVNGKKPYVKENGVYREAKEKELNNPEVVYFSDYEAIVANRILFKQKKNHNFGNDLLKKFKNN